MNAVFRGVLIIVFVGSLAFGNSALAKPSYLNCEFKEVKRSGLVGLTKSGKVRLLFDEEAKDVRLIEASNFMVYGPDTLSEVLSKITDEDINLLVRGEWTRPGNYGKDVQLGLHLHISRIDGEFRILAGPYREKDGDPTNWELASDDISDRGDAKGTCTKQNRAF